MAVRIEKAVSGCMGLGHIDGKSVFVKGALPGELCDIVVEEDRKSYSVSRAEAILEPSPIRRAPVCPYYSICGGCDFQILDEESSARIKEGIVKDNMMRIGKLESLPEFESPSFARFEGYRMRAKFHVSAGNRIGFLSKRSNTLVPVEKCPALDGALNALLADGREILRAAKAGGRRDSGGFSSVSAFSGDDEVSLSGRTVRKTVNGIPYSVSADVFFQSNRYIMGELLSFVEENTAGETVMDLYSGVGTFSALFDGRRKVYAVERQKECLRLARINAPHAIAFTDDVGLWASKRRERPDTVIVDPPRTGLGKGVPGMIAGWKSDRIIYVSCDSVTLARDLPLFEGYKPVKAKVFDFYPGSGHIETAVVLTRK